MNYEAVRNGLALAAGLALTLLTVGDVHARKQDDLLRLVNGSFEIREPGSPPENINTLKPGCKDIVGWEVIDPHGDSALRRNTVDWIGPTRWKASHGDHCLDLDGGIRQTIRTVLGESYEVRFDLTGNPELGPRVQTLRVLVDDRPHNFTFDAPGKPIKNMRWTTKRVVFKANSVKTTLTFLNANPNVESAGVGLDNVIVGQIDRAIGEREPYCRPEDRNSAAEKPPALLTVLGAMSVDLRDGSRLVGRPDVEVLLVESAIGTTEVPLAGIKSLEIKDSAGTAAVDLRDGSRLDGTLRPNPLTLQTSVGEINIPLAEVATCAVELAVISEGNVALSGRGAKVRGVFDGNSGPVLIDGNVTDYGGIPGAAHGASRGSAHVFGSRPSWVVELPQTYLLSEIRVLLWDRDRRFYRYVAETSVDGRTYRTAADRSQGEWRSWQKLAFSPRPVRYIRLRGVYSSRLKSPNGMHVVELEAYCHPGEFNTAAEKLVLWNRLGSKKEVHESEVGPGGTYSGEGGRFVEGRFGEALSAAAEEMHYQQPALVTFPKEVISTDAGCMEVWGKLEGVPKALKWGENPALLEIHDDNCSYILHLNGNDGSSNGGKGGLCGRAGGHASAGTGVFGTWTYEQVLGKGQVERWHHYALVWDKDGIPGVDDGTRTIALFLDGKLNSQIWRTGQRPWVNNLTGGTLRLLVNHHLSQGSVALDNLKIWNYAKTDFSDRFVEGIELRCAR